MTLANRVDNIKCFTLAIGDIKGRHEKSPNEERPNVKIRANSGPDRLPKGIEYMAPD